MVAKINISIDEELLAKIDNLAESSYTTRSGLIAVVMRDYIKSKELLDTLDYIKTSIDKIASTHGNTLDEDTLKELDTFKTLCKLVTKGNYS